MNIELGSNISTREIEQRIQEFWDNNSFWENDVKSDKPPFCTMMPLPNVTGALHMGHALNNSLTDFIVRYKRMTNNDVLWQPGLDHASIAMQLLIERDLSKRGINPKALTKEQSLKHAWEWKAEQGGLALSQLHMMGITPAWSRERFTMDDKYSDAVIKIFVKMFNEGLIYKAQRLVNWCPKQQTTVSDLEVDFVDEKGKFYYINYELVGGGTIEIATTRPETIFADQAIAIHPENKTIGHLIGKTAIIPLTNIEIPIIADEHANPEKGTGAVKITPAHDMDDWNVGKRHNLAIVSVLTDDAKMTGDVVPEKYLGMDRFVARKEIVADLGEQLTRAEDKTIPTPYSERGKAVIEYMVRDEWFVDAKKLAAPVIGAVESGKIKFLPDHRYNLFMSWMNNIHEWSISRQLWWGHQIPAWYDADGNIYVAESEEEAQAQAGDKKLIRENSTLDTWFSSAMWPFVTLGWPEQTPELKKYYPTDILITGYDIIFFWVARMCMMGMYIMDDVPFRTVSLHGIVRDKIGKKMSKTLGNGVEPDALIEKYGADSLRYQLSTTPIGQDVKYSEDEIKRGTKLLTKLWNASKYTLGNLEGFDPVNGEQISVNGRPIEDRWVLSELNKTIAAVRKNMDRFDTFNAREEIDTFFWSVFCDQYLEYIKDRFWAPEKYSDESRTAAQWTLWEVLRTIYGLYAPFIPFITEELWQKIYRKLETGNGKPETLHLTEYPSVKPEWDTDVSDMSVALDIIKLVRGLRTDRKIGGGAKLEKVIVNTEVPETLHQVILSGSRALAIEVDKSQTAKVDIVVQ